MAKGSRNYPDPHNIIYRMAWSSGHVLIAEGPAPDLAPGRPRLPDALMIDAGGSKLLARITTLLTGEVDTFWDNFVHYDDASQN